jgi:hypothetical protein
MPQLEVTDNYRKYHKYCMNSQIIWNVVKASNSGIRPLLHYFKEHCYNPHNEEVFATTSLDKTTNYLLCQNMCPYTVKHSSLTKLNY